MLLGVACTTNSPTSEATETERALCEAWGQSLPSRSSWDTDVTRSEIGVSYDVFFAACPGSILTFSRSDPLRSPLGAPEKEGTSRGGGA